MNDYSVMNSYLNHPGHLLIAGATGSGKSVAMRDFMYTLAKYTPHSSRFIILDPKRVDMAEWKHSKMCKAYATEPDAMIRLLDNAIYTMERTYKTMSRNGWKEITDDYMSYYVICDEFADLMVTHKKEFLPRIQRLAQLGRAAHIYVILATQAPSRKVLPAELTLNFTHRMGLRCVSPIESRQIVGFTGCECLPKYGTCYYTCPEGRYKMSVPVTTDEMLKEVI